jgi:hypothetical protein
MLGLWSAHAQQYLLWLTLVTTIVFALPIFCIPLVWARLMGWVLPTHTHLTVYFGRCLGAFILILETMMLRAALSGEAIRAVFEMLLAVTVMMIIVHVYGAMRRVQPLSETLEIGFYGVLMVLTLLFWPAT